MNLRMILIAGVISLLLFSSLPSQAINIAGTTDAETLANQILGTGISIVDGTLAYTGVENQSGTFTDGTASGIGFDTGIVLTSGNVNDIDGSNSTFAETLGGGGFSDDDISTDLFAVSGDSDLTALAGYDTYDAAVLKFGFQFGNGSNGGDLFFNFVFASEEYIDYIGWSFNDVFGFFVDGKNVALVPGTDDTPITVNSVNSSENSDFYRNNVNNTNGISVAGLENHFDGLTTVISAELLGLEPGPHTMKFAVADTFDGFLDAGVFIQAGSFSSENPTSTSPSPVPEPATMLLVGLGMLGLAGCRKRFKK